MMSFNEADLLHFENEFVDSPGLCSELATVTDWHSAGDV